MTTSLAEALPAEISRVRELLDDYRAIGPTGAFAAAMIKADLRAADAAMMGGDVVAMLRVYESLKGYTA